MHAGHEIVKCECGNVISPCRCTNLCGERDKPVAIQRPCKCEKAEEEEATVVYPEERK